MSKDKAKKELSSLDLFSLNKIEDEIKALNSEITNLSNRINECSKESGIRESEIKTLSQSIESIMRAIDSDSALLKEKYNAAFIEENEILFIDAYKKKEEREDIVAVFEQNKKRFETNSENLKKDLFSLRQSYNNRYHQSYDTTDTLSNKEFDQELKTLSENELPKHLKEIEDAKKSTRDQLKNDFLSKMSDNIKEVENQIKDFNKILSKYHFGGDTYKFTVSANKDNKNFYDMFMDTELVLSADMDDSLFGDAFSAKYEKEIEMLFSILVPERGDNKSDAEKEKQIAYYTDYKAYLVFDMEVISANGDVQKLSKNMKYKSGGETQIPFYISILVSFAGVCRMRETKGKSTVRLVIFDEAFSKMDGERIRTCLSLLKEDFDLQVIFSAPPEKLNDVLKYTSDILVTYKSESGSHIDRFNKGDNLKENE